jgi:hypothetical protein
MVTIMLQSLPYLYATSRWYLLVCTTIFAQLLGGQGC